MIRGMAMIIVFVAVTAGAFGLFMAMDRLTKPTSAPATAPLGAPRTPLRP
jgi:hypothetical protein